VSSLPELWFIRHGQTDWNLERRIQGHTDIELNETGHAQARAVASLLAGLLGDPAGYDFHVSPLKRPRQTMHYICDAAGVEPARVSADDRLMEICFGEVEGQTWPSLNARGIDPEADPEAYHDWRPSGGESYADATVRVRDWLDSLTRPTVAVAHGGISRIVRGLVLGAPKAEIPVMRNPQWRFYRLKDGAIEWFDAKHA
jgi:probable phosphoglycerate mutase